MYAHTSKADAQNGAALACGLPPLPAQMRLRAGRPRRIFAAPGLLPICKRAD